MLTWEEKKPQEKSKQIEKIIIINKKGRLAGIINRTGTLPERWMAFSSSEKQNKKKEVHHYIKKTGNFFFYYY